VRNDAFARLTFGEIYQALPAGVTASEQSQLMIEHFVSKAA
jgi:hypothetical protein